MYDRRYAAILTANKVETTVRLWSVLQADPTFLQTHLEISDEAAELIKKTVRGTATTSGVYGCSPTLYVYMYLCILLDSELSIMVES